MNQSQLYAVYQQAQARKRKAKHDQRDDCIIALWDSLAESLTNNKRLESQLDELSKDNRQYARDADMLHTRLMAAEGKGLTLAQFMDVTTGSIQ